MDTFTAPSFRPRADYILVSPVERKQSDVLHVVSGEKFTQGVVVAVGPGKKNKKGEPQALTVKLGQRVTYGDVNRGYDFYPKLTLDGKQYQLLQEADVCFVVDDEISTP